MCTVPALAAHGINLRFADEPARIIIRMFGRVRASCCANVSSGAAALSSCRQGPIQSLRRRRYLSQLLFHTVAAIIYGRHYRRHHRSRKCLISILLRVKKNNLAERKALENK